MNDEPSQTVITEQHLGQAVEAFAIVFAVLINRLEQNKIISKGQLARELTFAIDHLKATQPVRPLDENSVAIQALRKVAEFANFSEMARADERWKPIVIDGGKAPTER